MEQYPEKFLNSFVIHCFNLKHTYVCPVQTKIRELCINKGNIKFDKNAFAFAKLLVICQTPLVKNGYDCPNIQHLRTRFPCQGREKFTSLTQRYQTRMKKQDMYTYTNMATRCTMYVSNLYNFNNKHGIS